MQLKTADSWEFARCGCFRWPLGLFGSQWGVPRIQTRRGKTDHEWANRDRQL